MRDPRLIRDRYLATLAEMSPIITDLTLVTPTYKSMPLPRIMLDWMLDKIHGNELCNQVIDFLSQKKDISPTERKIFIEITKMSFQPEILATVM